MRGRHGPKISGAQTASTGEVPKRAAQAAVEINEGMPLAIRQGMAGGTRARSLVLHLGVGPRMGGAIDTTLKAVSEQ
eukprot:2838187-Alexandrium_andersonii.AAC.1